MSKTARKRIGILLLAFVTLAFAAGCRPNSGDAAQGMRLHNFKSVKCQPEGKGIRCNAKIGRLGHTWYGVPNGNKMVLRPPTRNVVINSPVMGLEYTKSGKVCMTKNRIGRQGPVKKCASAR